MASKWEHAEKWLYALRINPLTLAVSKTNSCNSVADLPSTFTRFGRCLWRKRNVLYCRANFDASLSPSLSLSLSLSLSDPATHFSYYVRVNASETRYARLQLVFEKQLLHNSKLPEALFSLPTFQNQHRSGFRRYTKMRKCRYIL